MKSEKIFKSIGNVDDELLERYESSKKKNSSPHWRIWGGLAAACFCVIAIGSVALRGTPDIENESYKSSGTVIENFQSGSMINDIYAAPENGKKVYFTEVTNALKEYAGKDVTYFLAVDIYANQIKLEDSSDEVKQELERLTKLGYQVGYSKYWTYQGNQEKVEIPYVSGYFTEKQLEDFAINEKYGYTFRFATNGDGGPVSADQGVVTDFNSEAK